MTANQKAIALVVAIIIVAILGFALSLPEWSHDVATNWLFERDTCKGKSWLPNYEISPDRRIEYCTKAIKSGRREGKEIIWAYNERGIAYASLGQYDQAIEDFDYAIKFDPQSALLHYNRGSAWRDKGDYDRAIAGYTEAIQLDSNYAPAYQDRGYVNFYKGDFSAAASDLLQSNNLHPIERSTIWLFLARGRLGQIDVAELSTNATKMKTKDWLYPVIEFYLGQRTVEQFRATASKPLEQCKTSYYLGEWYLLHGGKNEAKGELQTAADTCRKTYPEYSSAIAELKRINSQ